MHSCAVPFNLSPSRWRPFKVSLTIGAFASTVAVTLSINSLTTSWIISASDAASGLIALSLSQSNMNSSVVPLNLSPSRWRAFKVFLTTGAFASTVAVTLSINSLTTSWMISASDAASGLIELSLFHSNMHSCALSLRLSPSRWMPCKISLTTGTFPSTATITLSINSLTISRTIWASDKLSPIAKTPSELETWSALAWTVSTSARALKTASHSGANLSVLTVTLLADAWIGSCEFKSEESRKFRRRRVLIFLWKQGSCDPWKNGPECSSQVWPLIPFFDVFHFHVAFSSI